MLTQCCHVISRASVVTGMHITRNTRSDVHNHRHSHTRTHTPTEREHARELEQEIIITTVTQAQP